MERIPLHSWEMEFSIQYHVTINSQLNDQVKVLYKTHYCILLNFIFLLYMKANVKTINFHSAWLTPDDFIAWRGPAQQRINLPWMADL